MSKVIRLSLLEAVSKAKAKLGSLEAANEKGCVEHSFVAIWLSLKGMINDNGFELSYGLTNYVRRELNKELDLLGFPKDRENTAKTKNKGIVQQNERFLWLCFLEDYFTCNDVIIRSFSEQCNKPVITHKRNRLAGTTSI